MDTQILIKKMTAEDIIFKILEKAREELIDYHDSFAEERYGKIYLQYADGLEDLMTELKEN